MCRKLRVLLVDHQAFWGGGEVVVEMLAKELLCRGHSIAICGTTGSALELFCQKEGIKFFELVMSRDLVHRRHSEGMLGTLWSLLRSPLDITQPIKSLLRACEEFHPAVIHCHTLKSAVFTIPLILRSKLLGVCSIRYVYHDHTLTSSLFHRVIIYLFDTVICVSNSVAKKYMKERISRSKLRIIWNGVSDSIFDVQPHDLRGALGISEKIPIIAFSGRVVPGKGVHILIHALSLLLKKGYHFHAVIMGFAQDSNDSYQSSLEELINIYDLRDCVTTIGFLAREKSLKVLAGSNIIVMPSIEPESFGLVALEGLLLGRVIVGSNAGGLAEIIRKAGGILVRPGDTDSLVSGIQAAFEVMETDSETERDMRRLSVWKYCNASEFFNNVLSVYRPEFQGGVD